MMYAIVMKLIGSLILITLFLSCASGPEPAAPPAPVLPPAEQQVVYIPEDIIETLEVEEEVYTVEVSQERYQTTMAELQELVDQLNGIIRGRNYATWVSYLSEAYYRRINAPEFLEERTEELFRRDTIVASATGRTAQRRVLRTSRDYFEHIVVPSRSNDRVDDIAFITDNQVRAYTIDNRGNLLILYDLELIDGNWRIAN